MKTANIPFIPMCRILCTGVLLAITQLIVSAQDISSYKLITVDLAVEGETFTGTIVEKKKDGGYLPLTEGSLVSIQGQVVRAKRDGRVDIPPVSGATCGQPLLVEILFDGSCWEDTSYKPAFSSPSIALVPRFGSGKTNILHTPRLIRPGQVFTATGEGLDRIQTGGLRAADGQWIPMDPVAGSSVQQKYFTPSSLPPGNYRFEAYGADGTAYQAPVESVHPQLDMSGPSLKKVGQKGKIRIRSSADGTLTLWGGLPQIELMPTGDMGAGINADGGEVLLIEARGGEWIEIPFVARMVGQYNVTADLRTPGEAREEYGSGTRCDLLSVNTTVDRAANATQVETGIFVRETNGRPAVGSNVEVIVMHPGGMEMLSGVSNSAGLAVAKTNLPGRLSEESVTVAAFRTAGGAWQQEPFFSAHSATAFFNLDPGMGGDEEDQAALAEMYRRNKRQWGNYQGICGTALMEMCRLYPEQCEQFKKTEAEIETWLLQREAGEEPSSEAEEMADMPFDPAMADIYRENKRRWGNYQGICGTALMEMCRLYPGQCKKFEESEQAIENWLRELDRKMPDGKRPVHQGDSNQENRSAGPTPSYPVSGPDEPSAGQEDAPDQEIDEEEPGENPIPEEDRADLKNDVIRRAFEENDVTALRILEIKLGYLEAAVAKIGDQYYITYEKRVVFDPETGRPVNYWEFNEAQPLTAKDWYAIYLLSLGESPLNLLARIVESAESLGRSFLDDLFKDMQEKGDASRLLEIKAEHLILLHITASFDQGAMPQLGDHYREAEQHMDQALAAAEQGDWATAIEEWQAAQSSMAWLALEVMPGAGGGAGRATRRAAKPLVEVAQGATRNLDEVAEALRKAARSEANQDLARQMSRRADAVEEMAEKAKKIDRVTSLGKARPANFPVAAKDRISLEEYFGKNNVGTVGRRNPDNVLVVTDANGKKQVWVRPEYSDYKGAYEAVHGPIPNGTNVDHLQSRARGGQQGYGYVRLEVVDADVNQAWGRHMETRTVNAGKKGFVEPAGPAPVRHIDQFQWWKLQGIGPASVEDWIRSLGK